jgi:hypothetical protein
LWIAVLDDEVAIDLGVLALEQAGFMEVFKSESDIEWIAMPGGDSVKIGLSLLALEQAGSMELFKSVIDVS